MQLVGDQCNKSYLLSCCAEIKVVDNNISLFEPISHVLRQFFRALL